MYKGDNRSALLSQQLISAALLKLLETKAFSDISVSEMCKEAKVSRQTFYSLFGSKENVIIYELQNNCRYTPATLSCSCRSANFRTFCHGYSQYITDRKKILGILVKNDMMHCLYDVQYESLMTCSDFMSDITGEERIYLIDFIASGMNSIAKNYVLTGCRSDSDYLEKIMYSLFGGLFFIGNKKRTV